MNTEDYTIQQASEVSGFSEAKIRRLIQVGKLEVYNVSAGNERKRWIIRKQSLLDFITGKQ